jgi:DNA-binding NarL/FixJ family response regulator
MNASAGGVESSHVTATVYFLGRIHFSSEALASVVQRELAARCSCCAEPAEIGSDLRARTAGTTVLMIDSLTNDYETALLELHANPGDAGDAPITALYNLRAGTDVEKRAFTRGIRGFFYQNDSLDHVIKGIRALLNGELWVSRTLLVDFVLMGSAKDRGVEGRKSLLTGRESQILALVSVGASNDDIAEKLSLSPHTVKTHLYNVFRKINVPNRFQAALWAAKNL